MKIHSNILTYNAVADALIAEREAGRIAKHVGFKVLLQGRSQSHAYGIEIQLEAQIRDNGRRAGNSGSYGAMQPEYDGYAATYDEWGWLLAALYKIDPRMVVGSVKSPVYRDFYAFDERTALSYHPEVLLPILEKSSDPYPIVVGNAARTKRGYLIGRQGANRVDSQPTYWPGKTVPRTPEAYRAFAYPLGVPAAV
jgi:hypothetical protein